MPLKYRPETRTNFCAEKFSPAEFPPPPGTPDLCPSGPARPPVWTCRIKHRPSRITAGLGKPQPTLRQQSRDHQHPPAALDPSPVLAFTPISSWSLHLTLAPTPTRSEPNPQPPPVGNFSFRGYNTRAGRHQNPAPDPDPNPTTPPHH